MAPTTKVKQTTRPWGDRRESNPRVLGPQPNALPFGYGHHNYVDKSCSRSGTIGGWLKPSRDFGPNWQDVFPNLHSTQRKMEGSNPKRGRSHCLVDRLPPNEEIHLPWGDGRESNPHPQFHRLPSWPHEYRHSRGDRNRTCNSEHPKLVLFQIEVHPDLAPTSGEQTVGSNRFWKATLTAPINIRIETRTLMAGAL